MRNYMKQVKKPGNTAKIVYCYIVLITRRSEVQIFPPLPKIFKDSWPAAMSPFFLMFSFQFFIFTV